MNPTILLQLYKIVGQTELSNLGMATGLGEGKFWIQASCTLLKKKLTLCHISWVSIYILNCFYMKLSVVKIATPQHKHQCMCSVCKIYFFDRKNMATLSKLILQMVMYFHASSHVKPRIVKAHMQMRASRKEYKNNKCRHSGSLAFLCLHKLIRGEAAVSVKRQDNCWIQKEVLVRHRS